MNGWMDGWGTTSLAMSTTAWFVIDTMASFSPPSSSVPLSLVSSSAFSTPSDRISCIGELFGHGCRLRSDLPRSMGKEVRARIEGKDSRGHGRIRPGADVDISCWLEG